MGLLDNVPPAARGLLESRLSKMKPEVLQALEAAKQKDEEDKRKMPTAADLTSIAERVTQSDARAALAISEVNKLRVEVQQLVTTVLENTAAMSETRLQLAKVLAEMRALKADLGEKV